MFLPSLLKLLGENNLHHWYNDLFLAIVIVGTLPVSLASCKRTRSQAKIFNNYLRSATPSERSESLVQISIERDIA